MHTGIQLLAIVSMAICCVSRTAAASEVSSTFSVSQPLMFSAQTINTGEQGVAVAFTDEIVDDVDSSGGVDGDTEGENGVESGVVRSDAAGMLDRTHKIVSQRFTGFFRQLDNYFGPDIDTQRRNESWAKVRFDTIKSAGDDTRFKGALKLRVVLPKTEKRFRLLLSTEDDESDRRAQGSQSDNANDSYSLALRFIRQARRSGTVSLDLGTRYRERKAQVFGRVELNYSRDLKWNFHSSINNSYYYYSASGYENKFRYELSVPANEQETVSLRWTTDLLWAKSRRGTLIGETIGIYSDIDDSKALAIEGLASYTTTKNEGDINYFRGAEFRFRFRHNVWRRWFYYELWPSVSWASVNEYEPSYGGMVRIETLLGKY